MTLHAVILAGGSGTRFWPRSTRDRPKQFITLGTDRTLIQASFDRLQSLVPADRTWVVAGKAYAAAIQEQLPEVLPANVLLEPAPRDTAAAIGWAAATIAAAHGPDAMLAVLPSDHRIAPASRFREGLAQAATLARAPGTIVTLGIRPTRPATAFGYVQLGEPVAHDGPFPAHAVASFVEKPDLERARAYVAEGRHLWNGGIFILSARTMLDALEEHLPATRRRLARIVAARATPDAAAVLAREWTPLEKISIDYAVLEKAKRVVVLAVDFAWSDIGSWDAAAELFEKDEQGNAVHGAPFVGIDARRCVVAGDGRLVTVVGLEDVVVIQANAATLVCPRDRVEDVKRLVLELEKRGLDAYL